MSNFQLSALTGEEFLIFLRKQKVKTGIQDLYVRDKVSLDLS